MSIPKQPKPRHPRRHFIMSSPWPLGLYRVAGPSMLPVLRPGQLVVGLRWFRPRPGQLVIAISPADGRPLVKRLDALTPDRAHAIILGTNPLHSTDSRHFGPVPRASLRACVIMLK